MFNSIVCGTVKSYEQGTVDKNGKNPVIINIIAGECPNRTVLSGTVAEREGLELGKTYLIQVRETETDAQYGRQFILSSIGEVPMTDMVSTLTSLGKAKVFSIDGVSNDPETVEEPIVEVDENES